MLDVLKHHWPEYLMEAAGLGIFMISAAVFTMILEYPASPVDQAITQPFLRRTFVGIAMGLTAIAIIYSPWGRRSGAHLNPAITLTFLWLRKIEPWDALFYVLAQFIGGIAGVFLIGLVVGKAIADPAVNYVVTIPGSSGTTAAFIAEFIISFGLMFEVLVMTNSRRLARFNCILAGILISIYVALEAPFSGMSMNPARTLASAMPAHLWTALWVYFTAPPLGMLLAAVVYLWLQGYPVFCAKLQHDEEKRCIFRHGHHVGRKSATEVESVGAGDV